MTSAVYVISTPCSFKHSFTSQCVNVDQIVANTGDAHHSPEGLQRALSDAYDLNGKPSKTSGVMVEMTRIIEMTRFVGYQNRVVLYGETPDKTRIKEFCGFHQIYSKVVKDHDRCTRNI
jgi:hypothetical protein